MNITGRLSSIFFIGDELPHLILIKFPLPGLGVGSLSSPPLAGWLFLLQPLNVLWLVFVMVLLQVEITALLLNCQTFCFDSEVFLYCVTCRLSCSCSLPLM